MPSLGGTGEGVKMGLQQGLQEPRKCNLKSTCDGDETTKGVCVISVCEPRGQHPHCHIWYLVHPGGSGKMLGVAEGWIQAPRHLLDPELCLVHCERLQYQSPITE